MLRELKHLRAVIIYSLRMFEELNDGYSMASRLFVSITVHRFLDDLAIEATEQFLKSEVAEELLPAVPVPPRSTDAISDA